MCSTRPSIDSCPAHLRSQRTPPGSVAALTAAPAVERVPFTAR